jgi:hypothetical protein
MAVGVTQTTFVRFLFELVFVPFCGLQAVATMSADGRGRSKDGKRGHTDSIGDEGAPEKRSRGVDRSVDAGLTPLPAPQRLSCIWTGGPSHKFDSPVKGHPIFNIPVCYECIFEYFTGDFTSGEAHVATVCRRHSAWY